MTVAEIIQDYDADRPNQITTERKIEWLRMIEEQVIREVVLTHELDSTTKDLVDTGVVREELPDGWQVSGTTLYINGEVYDTTYEEFLSDFDEDTKLIVPRGYKDVYLAYMDQRAALMNNDTRRYNTAMTVFNNVYVTFQQWYNRTHRPLKKRNPFVHHRSLE